MSLVLPKEIRDLNILKRSSPKSIIGNISIPTTGEDMRSSILFLILCISGLGYADSPTDTSLYSSNGRQKAVVAVMPVIDHSCEKNIPWDISRELTDEMRKRVYNSSKLYLLKEPGSYELAELLNRADVDSIPSEVKNLMGPCEFVLVMELLEEKETPYGAKSPKNFETGALLSLAMRLRVIDLRREKPKVILQEILNFDQNVASAYMNCDYQKSFWGTESYERTPLGMAHTKLLRQATARVEGYIEAAR